jgi:hypothetical protein
MSFLLHGRSGSFGFPLLLVQRTYSCEVQESQEISDQGDLKWNKFHILLLEIIKFTSELQKKRKNV